MESEISKRAELAAEYFKNGYNCCQSVVMAYSDLFDANTHTLIAATSSFGGGVGKLGEVCGPICAMAFITGLRYPLNDPADKDQKKRNYEAVQLMAKEFAHRNGSLICRELLALPEGEGTPLSSGGMPAYYMRRPCARYVAIGATIVGEHLLKIDNRG